MRSLLGVLMIPLLAGASGAAEVDLLVAVRVPVIVEAEQKNAGTLRLGEAALRKALPGVAASLSGSEVRLFQPIPDSNSETSKWKKGADSVGARLFRLKLETAKSPAEVMGELGRANGVSAVEINQVGRLTYTPSDPLYGEQASDFALVNLEGGWESQVVRGAGSSVRVAVIDSGAEAVHEDLAGAIDLADSFNVAEGNTTIYDDNGHGTRIASLIGAPANNGKGIAGVAFGATILVYDVRHPNNNVLLSDVITAINIAVGDNADVISLSLAFDGYSALLKSACDAAEESGVLLVAAAGNDGKGSLPVYPAVFSSVLSVGALDDTGNQRAVFSNYNGEGGKLAEIFAPGSSIFSAIPGSQYNGTFGSGTSFAAPFVAGAGALLKTEHPEQSLRAIRHHLLSTAVPVPAFLPAGAGGAGRLDIQAALTTPMVPSIEVDSVTLVDGGDGDGVLDEGESATLRVTLSTSAADALNVNGVLSTASPSIQSLGNTGASFGDILHGETATNTVLAFGPITVVPGSPAGDVLFQLALTGDYGFSANIPVSLALENEVDISGVKFSYAFSASETYHVTGDLRLRNATTIPPGTTFKIDPDVDVIIENNCDLTAAGTAGNPIVFTSSVAEKDYSAIPPFGSSTAIGPRTEAVNLGDYAVVIYVDAVNGNDFTGDGTITKPYKSLTKAMGGFPQTRAPGVAFTAILAAEGRYTGIGTQPIELFGSFQFFGGYQPGFATRDIVRYPSVIDGENTRAGVFANNGSPGGIDGFFLVRCSGSAILNTVPIAAGRLIASNCFLIGNGATNGGAVKADSNLTVRNCLIAYNTATGLGGGIYTGTTGVFELRECVLIGNSAPQGSAGMVRGGSNIRNCIVLDHDLSAFDVTATGTVAVSSSAFWDNTGTAVKIQATASATRLYNNTFTGNGGGIESLATTEIVNNLAWGNGAGEITAPAGSVVQNNLMEGGFVGGFDTGTVTADPALLPASARGIALSGTYAPQTRLCTMEVADWAPPADQHRGGVMRMHGKNFYIAAHEGNTFTVVGDPTEGGAVPWPQSFVITQPRIGVNSPCRGAGRGTTASANVPANDIDGQARPSSATTDIGADLYDAGDAVENYRWGSLTFAPTALSATLDHVRVENGKGIAVEHSSVSLNHVLTRNHSGSGLTTSLSLASAIQNSTASENLGHGFSSPLTDLVGCTAEENGALGIAGRDVSLSNARLNGSGGMVAETASGCTATLNSGTGLLLSAGGTGLVGNSNQLGVSLTGGNLDDSEARENGSDGIVISGGGTIDQCTAADNSGRGIVTDGSTVSNSTSERNAGVGIAGSGTSTVSACRVLENIGASLSGVTSVIDSVIAGNGAGVAGATTVLGSYVAFNAGNGISGGTTTDSTILGNTGSGLSNPVQVTDCWIVRNTVNGATGSSAIATIQGSSILQNGGAGTKNVLSVATSNLYGNGTYDAEDNLTGDGFADRLFEGNYWGAANTTLLDASSPFTPMGFLRDNLDGSGDHIIDVWPYSATVLSSPPPGQAPPFVLSVSPNLDNPVNVGAATFEITFSDAMDTSGPLSVTFGLTAPYTFHVVEPAPGWVSPTLWQGTFAMESDTGDGLQTIRIGNAVADSGMVLPVDASHQFVIDADDPGTANNGLASAVGSDGFNLQWTAFPAPTGYQGYHVLRSTSGQPGTYIRVSPSILVTNQFVDSGLSPATLYFYIVDAVDLDNNSTQWTAPFYGTTGQATGVEEWIRF